jgi:hypothetical protein
MRGMVRSLLLPVLAWMCVVFTPLALASVAPEDAQSVKAVVRAQLDAFAADDARLAFSFAAPNIQSLFETPENFMVMVRKGYPVVYRPASVTFMAPRNNEADVVQPVQMRDSKGVSWLVLYSLRRQPDASWRISSCVVLESKALTV